jgi:hypothetical protein
MQFLLDAKNIFSHESAGESTSPFASIRSPTNQKARTTSSQCPPMVYYKRTVIRYKGIIRTTIRFVKGAKEDLSESTTREVNRTEAEA